MKHLESVNYLINVLKDKRLFSDPGFSKSAPDFRSRDDDSIYNL